MIAGIDYYCARSKTQACRGAGAARDLTQPVRCWQCWQCWQTPLRWKVPALAWRSRRRARWMTEAAARTACGVVRRRRLSLCFGTTTWRLATKRRGAQTDRTAKRRAGRQAYAHAVGTKSAQRHVSRAAHGEIKIGARRWGVRDRGRGWIDVQPGADAGLVAAVGGFRCMQLLSIRYGYHRWLRENAPPDALALWQLVVRSFRACDGKQSGGVWRTRRRSGGRRIGCGCDDLPCFRHQARLSECGPAL